MEQASTSPSSPALASGLNWVPQLETGDVRMDHTHEEFVTMLNQLLATPQDQQLPLYREFLEHTVEHFAQEERWMLATGFSEDNCHASHHATILDTMPKGAGGGGGLSREETVDRLAEDLLSKVGGGLFA